MCIRDSGSADCRNAPVLPPLSGLCPGGAPAGKRNVCHIRAATQKQRGGTHHDHCARRALKRRCPSNAQRGFQTPHRHARSKQLFLEQQAHVARPEHAKQPPIELGAVLFSRYNRPLEILYPLCRRNGLHRSKDMAENRRQKRQTGKFLLARCSGLAPIRSTAEGPHSCP